MRYLTFKSLLTPSILPVFYYVVMVAIIMTIYNVTSMGFDLARMDSGLGQKTVMGGLVFGLVALVFNRILCELILVIFMIRDELAWQREQQQRNAK